MPTDSKSLILKTAVATDHPNPLYNYLSLWYIKPVWQPASGIVRLSKLCAYSPVAQPAQQMTRTKESRKWEGWVAVRWGGGSQLSYGELATSQCNIGNLAAMHIAEWGFLIPFFVRPVLVGWMRTWAHGRGRGSVDNSADNGPIPPSHAFSDWKSHEEHLISAVKKYVSAIVAICYEIYKSIEATIQQQKERIDIWMDYCLV